MGRRRGARDPVNILFGWVRRQSVRVQVFLGAVAALVALVGLKIFVRDYEHFYIASEAVHAAGILILIYKLTRHKTCSGDTLLLPFIIYLSGFSLKDWEFNQIFSFYIGLFLLFDLVIFSLLLLIHVLLQVGNFISDYNCHYYFDFCFSGLFEINCFFYVFFMDS